MMRVRQVRAADLEAVLALAAAAGHGLTSLPKDPQLLRGRVLEACEAFRRHNEKPRGDPYLFVLEDTDSGRLAGCSGVVSKVGGFEPFYTFRIQTHVHESKSLGVRREIPCLHLYTEHSGPCEIGSLYLEPAQRRHGNGRLLSLSRFLFMAEYPSRFDPLVIAEMRGVVEDDGRCPFWEAVGRQFFDVEFPAADQLSARDKRFISDLMPVHPLYVPLLPREAREVLGQVHPRTRPALRMLEDEGFRELGWVDLFDGGPVIGCELGSIRAVRDSRVVPVGAVTESPLDGAPPALVAGFAPEFRAVSCCAALGADGALVLTVAAAEALGVQVGAPVRVVEPRPPRRVEP